MVVLKSLESISGIINMMNLNWLQPKFAGKSGANEKRDLNADELRFSILRFFWAVCYSKKSSSVLLLKHPHAGGALVVWPTMVVIKIMPKNLLSKLISKICPKFQVLSSHFSEVNEQHFKIVRSYEVSTTTYVQCDNCVYKRLLSRILVTGSVISYLAFTFNLSNMRMTILHAKKLVQGCEIWRVIYHFFFAVSSQ